MYAEKEYPGQKLKIYHFIGFLKMDKKSFHSRELTYMMMYINLLDLTPILYSQDGDILLLFKVRVSPDVGIV